MEAAGWVWEVVALVVEAVVLALVAGGLVWEAEWLLREEEA